MYFVPCHSYSGLICVWSFALQIIDEEETQFITSCPHAVMESTPRRRTNIQVYWTAPPSGSGCVLLKYVYNNANAVSDKQRQVCCLKVLICTERYWSSKTSDKRGSKHFWVFLLIYYIIIYIFEKLRSDVQKVSGFPSTNGTGNSPKVRNHERLEGTFHPGRLAERSEKPRRAIASWERYRLFCDSHCIGAVILGWHIATKADKLFTVSNISLLSSGQYG